MYLKGTRARTWGMRALVGATIAATAFTTSLVTAASAGGAVFEMMTAHSPAAKGAKMVTIHSGSTWAWRYSTQALPDDWNGVDYDAAGWNSGPGLLGRGVTGQTTNIDPTSLSAKPVSAQFRKAFTVTGAGRVHDGTVTVIADDGVVVYLNGVELGRANLPAGPLDQDTLATAAPRADAAARKTFTFVVPAKLLVEGTNVIAASVHANTPTTRDLSYDLTLQMPR